MKIYSAPLTRRILALTVFSLLHCGGGVPVSIQQSGGNTNPTNNNGNPTTPSSSGSNPSGDIIAPDTQIVSGPANSTTNLISVFQFTSTETGTFECRINGGTYTACLSPHSVLGLQPGSHRFEARALDAAGNADATAASWNWTITTLPVNTVTVRTVQELITAVEDNATPGTEIVLENGTYDFNGRPIVVDRAGQANNRIVVRPRNPGLVTIENDGATQAFQITQPYWTFENLNFNVNGPSARHAYKLDTNGRDIIIRGGRMVLAPTAESGIKGSGDPAVVPQPDNVLIEGTEIYFTSPSTNVVAEGIDAVGVLNWTIQGNTIHGIRRAGTTLSAQIAYAIVLKGNSQDSLIENNLLYDNFTGISVGGTTGAAFYRGGISTYENQNTLVRNNVISDSVDVAIYLENATRARIYNNTAYNSYTYPGGASAIDHRRLNRANPALYTADIRNNLLDKPINNRDANPPTVAGNLVYATVDGIFVNPSARDLRVDSQGSLYNTVRDRGVTIADVTADFSGTARPQGNAYDIGAYEQFGAGSGSGGGGGGGTSGAISLQRETGHGIPGSYYGQMGVADFDGDGFQDVVIAGTLTTPAIGPCNAQIRLYRNISQEGGAIRFGAAQILPNATGFCRGTALAVGDFNGDDRPDIAYQPSDGNGVYSGAYMNVSDNAQGVVTFSRPEFPGNINTNGGSVSLGLAVADVDQDGRDDVVLLNSGTITDNSVIFGSRGLWFTMNADGTAWNARQQDFFGLITYGGTIAAGDLNGDSYPEIAVGGNSNFKFGNQDCVANLQYGHVFRNRGVSNPGFDPGNPAVPARRDYRFVDMPNGSREFISPLFPNIDPDVLSSFFALRSNMNDPTPCHGSDNASYQIADMDGDGLNDIIVAGSAPGFGQRSRPEYGNSHYSLNVMFNNGGGANYTTWQNDQIDLGARNGNSTNSGMGNVELHNIAVGDLTGDGLPEIFIQGHRRNAEMRQGPNDGGAPNSSGYIFQSMLLENNGNREFTEANLNLPHVGEGSQAIADFNNDNRPDLIFGGALIPWHTNGNNPTDSNTPATIITEVYRNTAP